MNQQKIRLNQKIKRELGPEILKLLEDKEVCEIMLNEDGNLWAERFGGKMSIEGNINVWQAQSLLLTISSSFETTLTREKPIIECELPLDGSRFEGMIPPVVSSPVFAIRKKASSIFSLNSYVRSGVLSLDFKENIERAIRKRKNIIIAGGTGSGKTTLTNAIIDSISIINPEHRLVVMEDTKEVQISSENFVALQVCAGCDMTGLLRAAMRMRPDRIIVGEVRGGEALAMLKAWNTGHPGGVATLHANGALEALERLEQLVGEATLSPTGNLIGNAVDLIIFIRKTDKGRRVEQIMEISGYQKGKYLTKELFNDENINKNKSSLYHLCAVAGFPS